MHRRTFLSTAVLGTAARLSGQTWINTYAPNAPGDIVVERAQPGKPHAGKVLAAIQPHSDDIPIFSAGTVAKLVNEGYTGYLIRMTNDDMAGPGTVGDTVLANERDNVEVARVLGLKQVFDLNYSNHQMDNESRLEIRARLIFLIRLLKIDTVVCYDPWAPYEENPDHYVTAQSVEAACWMAGGGKDYPEHFAAGLRPHSVREKYYFARGPQLVNRVVDITTTIETKVESNVVNIAQGPAGRHGSALRARLAREGKRLPLLGKDDATADREYIKQFVLDRDREFGKRFGVEWAEPYHYIGPPEPAVQKYIEQHARPAR
ncbi:MAG: PIG-L family deacetylase [Bryobacterales bacterium]|nr:PIG-L family deacetylase [Bryobacterales bacterium]